MQTLIKNGRIIDPRQGIDGIGDILIESGVIESVAIGCSLEPDRVAGSRIIDAEGKWVCPGLVDMHVHFREPGEEYKETIETGARAAVAGGFTAVCTMPNTIPVNDCAEVTRFIIEQAGSADLVRVYPAAAISRGLEGKQLCEYGELAEAGAVAVTDDGRPVGNSLLMRRALEYASAFGLKVISHCEETSLSAGAMNEGALATRMGVPGIPCAAESVMVMRDIALARLTGVPVHIAHVSTSESVAAIRRAKEDQVPVTAETAPHYFSLTEEAVKDYATHAKMNPPLRAEHDRRAICQALADGTLDAIATDHAPHSQLEKLVEFELAANGVIGLETSLPLGLKLVADGVLSPSQLIERMSTAPARILGLSSGMRRGSAADIVIIDPELEFTVVAEQFESKARNTPFEGWTLKGKAVLTMVGGKTVYRHPDFS